MAGLGLCEENADDREVARLYFSGRCRMISPNAYFDEAWYTAHYADVDRAIRTDGLISGFVHFVQTGIKKGYWPNQVLFNNASSCSVPDVPKATIDEALYLTRYPNAQGFIAAFPMISPTDHYNRYGRFLNYSLDTYSVVRSEALSLRVAESEFDADFYASTYLAGANDAHHRRNPFQHYVTYGMKAAYSPNVWFDEAWYRAFYKEVREGIEKGWLPSGFYHYLLSGRIEGRMPKHDLALALEAKMPGVTNPSLLSRTEMLAQRMRGLSTLPKHAASKRTTRTIWIFLPTLNPDIMYGGYRAAIAFICALYRDGEDVAIVCVDEEPNVDYFLWSEKSRSVRDVFARLRVLNTEQFASDAVGRSDIFIAYTVWDLILCDQLVRLTDNLKPILLSQEYEPIFYDNGAQRALCEDCYNIPHYPVINSAFLKNYFSQKKLGVFRTPQHCRPGQNYTVFEHKINVLPAQTAKSMRLRSHRVMAVYARPEAHAARNLFEIAVIALQTLCKRGAFGPEWRFIGLGALTKLPPLQLGGGHELKLTQKMSEAEYISVMSELDIGISLMYAPHPSVVPFEFATTGALVVTNTFDNRSEAELETICGNIVPCDISIQSVVDAIERAMAVVNSFDRRERQRLRPANVEWDAIFSPDVVDGILSAVDGKKLVEECDVIDIMSKAAYPPPTTDTPRRRRIAAPAIS